MNNDLISRSAMLEDIQTDVENGGVSGMVAGALKRYVKRAPAVDAVIPVRCGKCMNWDTEKLYCHHPAGLSYCGKKAAEEGFCCFGERRADE